MLRHCRDRPLPDRLKPINIKADVDVVGEFPSIREINNEIRRLNLAYAPLRYVLPHKQAAYDKKYSTEIRGGEGFFRQADREESLIHLLRVNVLKRMESAVPSFALTVQRQLRDVEATLANREPRRGLRRSRSRTWTSTIPPSRVCSSGARSRCCGGRGPHPLETGLDRGSQPFGDPARGGSGWMLPVMPSAALREMIGRRANPQSWQPQGNRLHRLCGHRPLSMRPACTVGEDNLGIDLQRLSPDRDAIRPR